MGNHAIAQAVLLVCVLGEPIFAADDQPAPRPYRSGPLTKADFKAKVPDSRPSVDGILLQAVISTDIHHRYKYRFVVEDGQYRLTLTEISVDAVLFTEKSWNADPEDAELLDHEQGHFDIAAIHAARAQGTLRGEAGRGELTATGKDEAEGKQQLERRLMSILADELAAWRAEDRRYDRETKHGAEPTEQARHKAHHRRLLRELKVFVEQKKTKP